MLVVTVLVALGVSALCSVLEASLLSSSVVRLTRRKELGGRAAARMLDIKENRIDDAISAILTYNTVAHTVGAALAGAQAARVFGEVWLGVFSGVLTLLILVFTEIVPKTVGARHADRLAGFSGAVIAAMLLPPMKWILYITRGLTHLVAPKEGAPATTRGDVLAMVNIAQRDGALEQDESTLLSNMLRFDDIPIRDVITPRTVVAMFDEESTIEQILADESAAAFSRFPTYTGTEDNITGYVVIRDLLQAVVAGRGKNESIKVCKRPLLILMDTITVGDALKRFMKEHAHIAAVVNEYGALAGIATLEDLLETVLGAEIVDEFDTAVDLRQVAFQLRDRRLARMGITLDKPEE